MYTHNSVDYINKPINMTPFSSSVLNYFVYSDLISWCFLQAACETFCMEDQLNFTSMISVQDTTWQPGRYRLTPVDYEVKLPLTQGIVSIRNDML